MNGKKSDRGKMNSLLTDMMLRRPLDVVLLNKSYVQVSFEMGVWSSGMWYPDIRDDISLLISAYIFIGVS